MSVDTEREFFHLNFIKPTEIEDFLSAQTYRPAVTSAYEKVLSGAHDSMQSLCLTSIRQGATPTFSIKGAKCLKSKQTREILLDDFGYEIVDPKDPNNNSIVKVNNGDIIVTRQGAGTIGRASIFYGDEETYITDSLFLIRVDPNLIDSSFLAVYLRTYTGQRLIEKGVYGSTGQLNLSSGHLRKLPVIRFDKKVQKYIGDKVRQAEKLRKWANKVQKDINDQFFDNWSSFKKHSARSYKAQNDFLSELRLDSHFYHPDFVCLIDKVSQDGAERLGKYCSLIKDSWNKNISEFAYYEIGGLNVSEGTINYEITQTEKAPSRAKTALKQGDILVSTVRPNRKNVAFVIDNLTSLPMVGTSGFAVLRFESLTKAAFYHAWLRTDDATNQLLQWNTGSAYPAIEDDVPLQIWVPKFNLDFVENIGELALNSQFALTFSKKLIQAAKVFVEELIEGVITEKQLIEAQQALEVGDTILDRELLALLTQTDLNDNAKPLFDDLDQLYDLLAQSKDFMEAKA